MKEDYLIKVKRALNKINFDSLIQLSVNTEVEDYSFREYKNNNFIHKKIIGYCTDCESNKLIGCKKENCTFAKISHGSHSIYFIDELGFEVDSTWKNEPILFLLENPSKDYKDQYLKGLGEKRPAQKWYWVDLDVQDYNKNIENDNLYYFDKQKSYSYQFANIIEYFKLQNVYITNIVKCGLENSKGKYQNTSEYNYQIIKNCEEKFLKKEIDTMSLDMTLKLVFVFGPKTKELFLQSNLYKSRLGSENEFIVIELPHPSSRCINRNFRSKLIFYGILEGLYKLNKSDVLTDEEYIKHINYFKNYLK